MYSWQTICVLQHMGQDVNFRHGAADVSVLSHVEPNQPWYVWLSLEKTNTTDSLQLFYILLRMVLNALCKSILILTKSAVYQ